MKYQPTDALFYGGRAIDLLKVSVEDIDFEWIADRLSKIPRFLAGTREPFSVAQHSVFVMDRVSSRAKPWALLHDAPEALIGDFIRPVIKALDAIIEQRLTIAGRKSEFSEALADLHWTIGMRVHQAAALPRMPPADIADEVKAADDYAADVELRALIRDERIPGGPVPVSQARAKADFLAALRHVCPTARGLS